MTSKILPISAIAVGFVSFVLGIVGLCTNYWRNGDAGSLGLWKVCTGDACDDLYIGKDRVYTAFEIVRGFGILSVIMAFAAIVFGVLNLVVGKLNLNPSVMATFHLMGALFGLICASVFSSLNHVETMSWGYSFILTWLAFPFSLVAGVVMTYAFFKSD